MLSRKSTELVIGIVLGGLDYAKRRGLDVPAVSFGDIQLGKKDTSKKAPWFSDQQVAAIIYEASEPQDHVHSCLGGRQTFRLEQNPQLNCLFLSRLAEACESRTHHSAREEPNRRL